MKEYTAVIHKTVRKYLINYLVSVGYRVHVVDAEPYENERGLAEQRFICGYRFNAVVLTITEGVIRPNFDFILIHTDSWLLLKYGKITFDFLIIEELMIAIEWIGWAFRDAETEEDRKIVQSLLKCTDEEIPLWNSLPEI